LQDLQTFRELWRTVAPSDGSEIQGTDDLPLGCRREVENAREDLLSYQRVKSEIEGTQDLSLGVRIEIVCSRQ
jgi:hypothetical protein